MNNAGKVEAYKSFYEQAKQLYAEGDIPGARMAFLRAAELANDISKSASTHDVKMEYYRLAAKILDFVKTHCSKKEPIKSGGGEQKGDMDEIASFKPVESDENKVTFDDVAGLEDVKDEIRYKVLAPISNPDLAKKYKIKPGGKILLYGPPGTGKTFIARAIAGEVDAKFFAVNCQDLISKYMGESSKQLDALFETAQKNERAIIFFDEFDSVASKRGDGTTGVDAEMARFVATFLTKVDGFKQSKTCKMLLLIAATNRPWAIDTAMLRGGRFDTQIYVGLPDYKARLFMVNKTLGDLPLDSDVSLEEIADKLEGFGGGDVVAICDRIKLEAYKRAVKTGEIHNISFKDVEKVLKGIKNVISVEEVEKFEKYRVEGFI